MIEGRGPRCGLQATENIRVHAFPGDDRADAIERTKKLSALTNVIVTLEFNGEEWVAFPTGESWKRAKKEAA